MKYLFTIFCVTLFLTANLAWGQLLLEENFDYTAGDSLNVLHGWTVQTTPSYVNTIKVISPGLTYTGYASNLGNAAKIDTTGQDIYHTFTDQTSGSVYASMIVNISKATTTGDYFFHFTQATTTNFRGRLFVKSNGTNIAFGLLKGSTGTAVYTPYSYDLNTNYLLVLKYTFNTGTSTDDSVFVFVEPSLSAPEPEPTLRFGSTDADLTTLNAINLRQGTAANAPRLTIDGIRVATAWSQAPLPVEVKSISAVASKYSANLVWKVGTEVNAYGYEILRREIGKKEAVSVGFVRAEGLYEYSFSDANVKPGRYIYEIKQIDNDGTFKIYSASQITVGEAARELRLDGYPNPFNPTTNIEFTLPENGFATLKVYNIIGQEVAALFSGNVEAGIYTKVQFNASQLSSGMYFSVLEWNNQRLVKKLMLTK